MPGYTYQPTTKSKKAPETQFADTLQTTENLKQQASPLTNALAPVTSTVTEATKEAGNKAATATTAVNNSFNKPAVSAKIQVNQSAYATPQPAQQAATPAVSQEPAKVKSIEGALGADLSGRATQEQLLKLQSERAGISSDADVAALSQQAANEAAARDVQVKNLTDFLTNKQLGKGIEATPEGGSLANANVGELGQLNALEQEALARQAAIANGAPTSNYDALSAALGGSFDPRLAALESQVYNTDLQKMKGQAQADYAAQEQANATRTGQIGDYKKSLESALTTTQDVAKEKQKEADVLLEGATEKAKKDAQAKIDVLDKQIKDVSELPAKQINEWTSSVKTLATNNPEQLKKWDADTAALGSKSNQEKFDGTNKIAKEINSALAEKTDLLTKLQNKPGVPAETIAFVQEQVKALQFKANQANQNLSSYKQNIATEKATADAQKLMDADAAKWKIQDDKAFNASIALIKGETETKQADRLKSKVIPQIDKDIQARQAELNSLTASKADPRRSVLLIEQIKQLQKRKDTAQAKVNTEAAKQQAAQRDIALAEKQTAAARSKMEQDIMNAEAERIRKENEKRSLRR